MKIVYDRETDTLTITLRDTKIRYTRDDPLEEFKGVFHSDVLDWEDQYDKYLGQ